LFQQDAGAGLKKKKKKKKKKRRPQRERGGGGAGTPTTSKRLDRFCRKGCLLLKSGVAEKKNVSKIWGRELYVALSIFSKRGKRPWNAPLINNSGPLLLETKEGGIPKSNAKRKWGSLSSGGKGKIISGLRHVVPLLRRPISEKIGSDF